MSDFNYTAPGNTFDSRDVQERIDEMELEYGPEEGDSMDTIHVEKMEEEEREEYKALNELLSLGLDATSEWYDGALFIAEDYFTQYAEQLADDIGAIDSNATWPLRHIDWEAAADDLKQDYTEIEFRDATYFVRA